MNKGFFRCEHHIGDLGILIKSGYRGLGIGSKMIDIFCRKATELGLELIQLSVFSSNNRGIHVNTKSGFFEVGRIPDGIFRNGVYME